MRTVKKTEGPLEDKNRFINEMFENYKNVIIEAMRKAKVSEVILKELTEGKSEQNLEEEMPSSTDSESPAKKKFRTRNNTVPSRNRASSTYHSTSLEEELDYS